MGTRGALGYRLGNQDKVTYNHYDSYPSGLGLDVIKHIRSKDNLDQIKLDFHQIKLVDEQGIPSQKQIDQCQSSGLISANHNGVDGLGVNRQVDWYVLLRDTQGDLQKNVDCGFMMDSSEFLADSLFCEWAYIINLDTEILEIYKGFQKKVGKGRYAKMTDRSKFVNCDSDYFGVSLVGELNLVDVNDYPLSIISTFLDYVEANGEIEGTICLKEPYSGRRLKESYVAQ
jgi:hypothetical protein